MKEENFEAGKWNYVIQLQQMQTIRRRKNEKQQFNEIYKKKIIFIQTLNEKISNSTEKSKLKSICKLGL